MSKASDAARQSAIEKLHEMLKPGDTVSTILRHVSRSGMSRRVSVVMSGRDGCFEFDWLVAKALGYRIHKDGGLVVEGCGMDMGFAVVYELGRALWPEGFKTWPGYRRNGPLEFDEDGGYALRQRWL